MQNRGLLFIPDISGFTQFVNEMELDHSRMVIQELLEVLINANEIGLEVSEIEGDAILFYRFGNAPGMQELYKQVERMFCSFHRRLLAYEQRRYCQCKACEAAIDLTLKVITHYGEFTGYNVKNFSKLIGKDVIVAHQLLKNDIAQHEYWLITNPVARDNTPAGLAEWMRWNNSIKPTETGEIPFYYTPLSPLKNNIAPEPVPAPDLTTKTKVVSVSKEYAIDIIMLFHATGDFTYRDRWFPGVKKVEGLDHLLPRVGMRCRCIMENGEVTGYVSTYYRFRPDRIEFCETDDKGKSAVYYTLERTGENRARFTLDLYMKKNFIDRILFLLGKKRKMEQGFQRSLSRLEKLLPDVK